MKPYKDPDEFIKALGPEAFEERINQAVNSFLFEIEVIEKRYDFKDPESKTAFFKATAKKLLEFTEEIERNTYVEAVAERYHLPYEKLKKMVDTMGEEGNGLPARERPRSGIQKKQKEDGITKAQKLLITWMISDDRLFEEIKKWVSIDDFTNELYRTIVEMLYAQKAQGKIKPAEIISHFADSDRQGEIASLFHAELKQVEKKEELEKALTETIIKVKEHSYNVQIDEMDKNDMMAWQRILQEKSKLQKLHISL
jgi:DNA primase